MLAFFGGSLGFAQEQCILVKLSRPPAALGKRSFDITKQTGITVVDATLSKLGAIQLSTILPSKNRLAAMESAQTGDIYRWFKIILPDSTDQRKALEMLRLLPDVEEAQLNRAFHLDYIPNDPYLGEQWAFSKIGAFAAWDLQRGSPQIPVAIIDTGIDYTHPDLAENIWINSEEDIDKNGIADANDLNGLDDDGNGFIDDVQGWDFTDAPNYPDSGDYLVRDNDPKDEAGHGTAVAGIVAAVTDNSQGIAGLAHQCRLMNLRAFTAGGNGEEDDVASAILYAIHNGARVINMSWGDVFVSRLLDDVIRYASTQGIVMVASAGNSATDQIHYPSGFAGTISVGASDENDNLASFSNYGSTIDLVAPGVNIYTATLDGQFSTWNGTSFSAPFVSASAGLLLSQDAALSSEAIRGILTRAAIDLGNKGWDNFYGAGRLEVARALSQPLSAIVKISSPKLDQGFSSEPIEIVGSAWSPMMESYSLFYGEGDDPSEWQAIASEQISPLLDDILGTWESLPDKEGSYTIRLQVKNRDGSTIESFVRIFIDPTPPQISHVETLPMIDGDHHSALIQFKTDDLCEGSIFYRPAGSTGTFAEALLSYRTNELRINISQKDVSDHLEFKIQVRNGAGLITEDDNQGRYYSLDLSAPPLDVVGYTPTELSIPPGYLLNSSTDFNENGLPEIILGSNESNSLGPIKYYEFDGTAMVEAFAGSYPLIPRDIGDTDDDGKPELLCGLGFSSYLFKSPQPKQWPTEPAYQWTGDGTSQYWASRIADLDGDGSREIILRVVKPTLQGSADQFEVWETADAFQFAEVASFPNPTYGGNQNGVPHCETGDFDGDGRQEILFGDSDGDLYIYENSGDNAFVATWQDSLPLLDSIDYLSAGDYDGDGAPEFIAGCHSDPNLNTEHYYDSRHWYYRIYHRGGDNRYQSVADWRFFGFESPKDFASGVSSGDVDGDGRDEILLCLFPDFYLIDYTPELGYQLDYYHTPAQSNAVAIMDANGDGQKEFWLGNNQNTQAFIEVGVATGPATPVGLRARPLDENHVSLTWHAVTGAERYATYRGSSENNLELLSNSLETIFVDENVQPGVRYWYAVAAIDLDKSPDTSSLSQTVSARPGARPFLLSARMESTESIRLRFSEPMNESLENPGNYAFSNDLGRPTSAIDDASGWEVVLSLARPFSDEGSNSVTTLNLEDLDSTPMDSTRNVAIFEVHLPKSVPFLTSGILVSANEIDLAFNEAMEQASIQNIANYDLGEAAQVSSAVFAPGSQNHVRLQLVPRQPFGALGKTYTIRVHNLLSAAGVAIEPGRGDFLQLIFAQAHLTNVFTYPNPYNPALGENKITFANLTREAEIRIMTIEGQLVRKLHEENGDGGVEWDLRDEHGQEVAAGIYIFRVESAHESAMGKLAILR